MNAQTEIREQPYPGGEDHPWYRLAFRTWLVLFLLLICVGLLNYLGTIWAR